MKTKTDACTLLEDFHTCFTNWIDKTTLAQHVPAEGLVIQAPGKKMDGEQVYEQKETAQNNAISSAYTHSNHLEKNDTN